MFIKSCILNMYTVLFLSFPVFLGVIISCLVPVLLPVFFFLFVSPLCVWPRPLFLHLHLQLCVSQPLCVHVVLFFSLHVRIIDSFTFIFHLLCKEMYVRNTAC